MTKPYTRPLHQRIARRIDLIGKRIHNYRFYRARGHSVRAAWQKAGETL